MSVSVGSIGSGCCKTGPRTGRVNAGPSNDDVRGTGRFCGVGKTCGTGTASGAGIATGALPDPDSS